MTAWELITSFSSLRFRKSRDTSKVSWILGFETSELYEIWDKEYKEGKKKFNKKEGKKPIQKKKKASTKMSAWEKFLFTNRTNLPAAKYNEHRELKGWKLDKPVQFNP